jgi:hypothetical protein
LKILSKYFLGVTIEERGGEKLNCVQRGGRILMLLGAAAALVFASSCGSVSPAPPATLTNEPLPRTGIPTSGTSSPGDEGVTSTTNAESPPSDSSTPASGEYELNIQLDDNGYWIVRLTKAVISDEEIRLSIEYTSYDNLALDFSCRYSSDPKEVFLYFSDGGDRVDASRTFCSDNPRLNESIEPGETRLSYAVFPNDIGGRRSFFVSWYTNGDAEVELG